MKNTKENTCPEEWMIQAFIDGELVGDEFVDIRNHINICSLCQKRVVKRQSEIRNIMDLMDITLTPSQSVSNIKTISKFAWFSVAASLLVLLGLGIWFKIADNKFFNKPNCEWVELSNESYNPQFVSPNNLYNNRVIEVKEVGLNGITSITYLIKQCDNH